MQTGRSALCMRTKLVCDRHHLCGLYTWGIRPQGQAFIGPAHAVLPRSNRLWTLRSLGYQCGYDLWFRNIDGVAPCLFHCWRPCTLAHEALRCRRKHFVVGRDQVPTGLGRPRRLIDLTAGRAERPMAFARQP